MLFPSDPKLWRKLGRRATQFVALGLATLVGDATLAYVDDVDAVKRELAHKPGYIMELSPPKADDHQMIGGVPEGVYKTMDSSERSAVELQTPSAHFATLITTGFGRVETPYPKKPMKGLTTVGALWEYHYANGGLDIDGTAEKIKEKAADEGITVMGFYGDSMGGLVSLELAVKVSKIAPGIRIAFDVLDSTPVDVEALRTQSKDNGMELINGIRMIPGAEYSRYLRVIAETQLRWEECLGDHGEFDLGRFVDVVRNVWREVFDNSDLATNALLDDQFRTILDSDAADDLHYLGHLPIGSRPTIAFIRAEEAKEDDVVNVDYSQEKLEQWTRADGLIMLKPFPIKGLRHGNQFETPGQYDRTFDVMLPQMNLAGPLGPDQPGTAGTQ